MKNAGFSLLEILVALTVFSIASVALTLGVTTSIRTNATSERLTQATILAQDKLEALLASNPTLLAGSDVPRAGFTRTWTILFDTPQPGVAQVNVSVVWADSSPHTVTVSTVVNK
ncbi:MAG: type II secretion system protein [Deltaproteobacteria bacterium]|nr:type II secretion system protein [Deltaproteobacteria bacterium]